MMGIRRVSICPFGVSKRALKTVCFTPFWRSEIAISDLITPHLQRCQSLDPITDLLITRWRDAPDGC